MKRNVLWMFVKSVAFLNQRDLHSNTGSICTEFALILSRFYVIKCYVIVGLYILGGKVRDTTPLPLPFPCSTSQKWECMLGPRTLIEGYAKGCVLFHSVHFACYCLHLRHNALSRLGRFCQRFMSSAPPPTPNWSRQALPVDVEDLVFSCQNPP